MVIKKFLNFLWYFQIQIKEFKKQVETEVKNQKLKKNLIKKTYKSKELNSSSNKSTEKTQIKNSNFNEKEDPIITAYNEKLNKNFSS